MKKLHHFTQEKIIEELAVLRQHFFLVRLFDQKKLDDLCKNKATDEEPCYQVWNRKSPCRRCTTCLAYLNQKEYTKLEERSDDIFEVTSKFLYVDKKPCVLEIVKRFDTNFIQEIRKGKYLSNGEENYFKKVFIDALTSALNRRFYEERLKDKMSNIYLSLLDIDDFKLYNDVFGHKSGDMVLSTLVKIIKKHCQKSDSVLRYGGDEFLIFSETTDENHTKELLSEIQSDLTKLDAKEFKALPLTLSIGTTHCHNEIIEDAIQRADSLMYEAKKNKKLMNFDDSDFVFQEKVKPSVLISDDSSLDRETLSSLLKNDFSILTCEKKEEALSLIKNKKVNLLILDLNSKDSFQLLEILHNTNQFQTLPVLVSFSSNGYVDLKKAFEFGAFDYISKPINSKILYRRVTSCFELYSRRNKVLTLVNHFKEVKS